MTLKEKIERECPTHIHLYREGIFWKLYNQSAFHFSQLIKPYQVKKKYIKTLGAEVVSIGFPQSVLNNSIERLKELSVSVETGEHMISITLLEEQNGYEDWFQQFPLTEKANTPPLDSIVSSSCPKENETKEYVLQSLRDFPIIQKTPLEVQLFVLQLQDYLKSNVNKH